MPSLRNVALTAPDRHDQRFKRLEEVLAHYATGVVRSAALDPNLATHPNVAVPLTAVEQPARVAVLKTLADPQLAGAEK